MTLVVVDDALLIERSPGLLSLMRSQGRLVGFVVLADLVDQLPAACTAVVEALDDRGLARVSWPSQGRPSLEVLLGGIAGRTALGLARSLGRFSDPDCSQSSQHLVAEVSAASLFDLAIDDEVGEVVAARWAERSRSAGTAEGGGLAAALGIGADGERVAVDLVADGPHALVAGTTGSGKSELLRTWVAGMALACGPDEVSFVLIDYKGGSAFDACAGLPHTVAVVTDLDEELGERALCCLDAELHRRERLLRDAGCTDLEAYRLAGRGDREVEDAARPGLAALPRLVVVVDEFAGLAAELPGFVDALVGIAQRGRSLGVHLVLATQRPAGVVSEAIRANVNLRIALRVQTAQESRDVIGTGDAADLPPDRPGRALVRVGNGEPILLQVGSTSVPAPRPGPVVRVRPSSVRGPVRHAAGTSLSESGAG